MRVQVINTQNLTSEELNLKGGTLEETLRTSENNYNLDSLVENGDIFKIDSTFIGNIIYRGKTAGEYLTRGRVSRDWTETIKAFNLHYKTGMTAKQVVQASGLSLAHVYYMAKKLGVTLAKGKRGKKAYK